MTNNPLEDECVNLTAVAKVLGKRMPKLSVTALIYVVDTVQAEIDKRRDEQEQSDLT